MLKNFGDKRLDHLIEILSVIAIVLVFLMVIGGFARLALDYLGYVIPLVAVVLGAVYIVYRVKQTNF
jgi:hypothetical protein